MCVGVLPASMSVHHMCAWFLRRPEESPGFPGVRKVVSCPVGAAVGAASSGGAAIALLCWAISAALNIFITEL